MFSTALWTRNVHTFALFVVGRAEAPLLPAAMAGSLEQKWRLGYDVFTSTTPPAPATVRASQLHLERGSGLVFFAAATED